MTVGPPLARTMCSETNVTITSLRVHSPSSLQSLNESVTDSCVNADRENDVIMTSFHGRKSSDEDSSAADVQGQRVSSVSRGLSESVHVVTLEEAPPEVSGVGTLWKFPAEPTSTAEECSKLVIQLSKELALLHALSRGVGAVADSDRLREELRASRSRACALARHNGTGLVPLFKSKQKLNKRESGEVERLYMVYTGCLEYLLLLLLQIKALLEVFRSDLGTCHFIHTGITDPIGFVPRTCNAQKEVSSGQWAGEGPSHHSTPRPAEELAKLTRDISDLQKMLHAVTSACDIQPWDVQGESPQKRRKSSGKPHKRQTRTVTFAVGSTRRQRVLKAAAALTTVLVVIVVAVTLSLISVS